MVTRWRDWGWTGGAGTGGGNEVEGLGRVTRWRDEGGMVRRWRD